MPSPDMDAERPKSRETILTENTDDFIIGDRVWVNGTKPGYIQYLGETRFSPGDWAGVVLDDNSGKNDGSVAGVRYFQCEPKRGVFARLHKLTRYPLLHVCTTPTKLLSETPPPSIQRCITPTRTPSPGARNLREGDRVMISSSTGPNKNGILRYLGHTDFAAGEWAGVELDEPLGKNDGTVAGKRYFRCAPNYGLFSPAHKVTRLSGSLDRHRRTLHGLEQEKDHPSNGSSPNLQVDVSSKRYAEESEKRAQRLRELLDAAEAQRKELAAKLEEERKKVEELEFRIEEECITKDDLEAEREKERHKIEDLERRLEQESRKNEMAARGVTPDSILKEETKRLNDEIKSLKEKLRQSETKLKEFQNKKASSTSAVSSSAKADELIRKEEALLQAQLSLDNKKREVQNLLNRLSEQEKELEKSKTRHSRQLDIIDELNMRLQKSENKVVNLGEEVHAAKERSEELERRLKSALEQVFQVESEKNKLQTQLVSPESSSKEQTLLSSLKDKEKEVAEWKRVADTARSEVDQLKEARERQRRETESRILKINEEHREQLKLEKKRATESEERNAARIRDLERILTSAKDELESARLEAEARLSRQEARLQEAELRTENLDRLRDQISRLQAEKDLLRVEKEETWKRLQISEQNRSRWETEANRASDEVNLLKSQVQNLRTEFTGYREDLVKQLAQTELDNQVVQDLHMQIETQRRIVEQMQQRLKWTEGERDQLHTELNTHKQGHVQIENNLRHDMDSLRRSLEKTESEKQSLKRSLEAAQLFIEERAAAQQQLQARNFEKLTGEKLSLEQKLSDLQRELVMLKNGKSQPDATYEELRKEKEALEQQVNFMNSVIVDMQHKNDDLKSRLEILETEVIFDGNLQLGLPYVRSTSRAFCDICDTFDTHDTEDCPKQTVRRNLSYSSQESEF